MSQAPTLETERLRLRAHRAEDLPRCVKMWADPVVTRYTIGAPSSEQRTWLRILAYAGHWELLGFGYWAVEEKASGLYVGELGFADFKRENHSELHGIPELGWALMPEVHGKGFATEALRAAVQWGDKKFDRARTVCLIRAENRASLRVAEKLGFREFARKSENAATEILFSRY